MLAVRHRRGTSTVRELGAPRTLKRPKAASELTLHSACATLDASRLVSRVTLWLPGLSRRLVERVACQYELDAVITERANGCAVRLQRKEKGATE